MDPGTWIHGSRNLDPGSWVRVAASSPETSNWRDLRRQSLLSCVLPVYVFTLLQIYSPFVDLYIEHDSRCEHIQKAPNMLSKLTSKSFNISPRRAMGALVSPWEP